MSWVTLTTDMVKARIPAAERDVIASTLVNDPDPLPEIIAEVVDEARGYISAGGFQLGLPATLPQRLVAAAVAIVRYRFLNRLNVSTLLTDTRKKEHDDAVALLDRVSEKRFAIEQPLSADTETPGGMAPVIRPKRRDFTHRDEDGI